MRASDPSFFLKRFAFKMHACKHNFRIGITGCPQCLDAGHVADVIVSVGLDANPLLSGLAFWVY